MKKLSERFMYYSGILAAHAQEVVIEDLKHIQNLIDAEEQEMLFQFPVKVGDHIYLVTNDRIDPCEIIELHIGKYVKGISIFNPIIGIVKVALVEMGKMIFLTREEAETALKKMQEGKQ